MKKILYILAFLPFILTAQKACPDCYGAGSNATGGRGGGVVKVTNLNASGAGSFRAALETSGAQYIVFDVSGVIHEAPGLSDTNSGLTLSSITNKTILGQTAPRGGITLTGGKFRINNASNIIMRYIRSRPIKNKAGVISSADDAHTSAFLMVGSDNIMFDHLSASFSQDKAINFYKNATSGGPLTRNITVSNSLIADSNTMMNIGSNPGNDISENKNASVFFNLYGNSRHRTPNMELNGYGEISNNIIHGWGARLSNVYHNLKLNHIANYYKNPGLSAVDNKHQTVGASTGLEIYSEENFYTGRLAGTIGEDNHVIWSYFSNTTQLPESFFTNTMHTRSIPNPHTLLTASEAYDHVLANAGANAYIDDDGYPQTYIDDYDQSVINNVITNTRVNPLNTANWVLPSLPSSVRSGSYDTDNDGMADAWEVREFGNLTKTATGRDLSADYDNIEVFANQVDGEVTPPTEDDVTSVEIFPKSISLSVGNSYQFTKKTLPSTATDTTGTWTSTNTDYLMISSTGLATVVSVPANLTINGTLDADTGWTKQDAAITISGGKANWSGAQTLGKSIYQDLSLVHGKYIVYLTISNYVSGFVKAYPGGYNASTEMSGDGIKVVEVDNVHPSQDGNFWVQGNSEFEGSVDDIQLFFVPEVRITTMDGGFTDEAQITVLPPTEFNKVHSQRTKKRLIRTGF